MYTHTYEVSQQCNTAQMLMATRCICKLVDSYYVDLDFLLPHKEKVFLNILIKEKNLNNKKRLNYNLAHA